MPGDKVRDLPLNSSPSSESFTYIVDGLAGDGKANKNSIREWLNLSKSQVTLIKDGVIINFTPSADTNAARETALRYALGESNSTSSVYLGPGNYKVSDGSPLIDSVLEASYGVKIHFSEGAALLYDDPEDAGSDYSLFVGIRNPIHFGAIPDITFQGSPSDSWSAFQAAKFSLPPVDGGSVDEFGDLVRTGTVEIPDGKYAISAPFVSQAGQTWRGSGGRTVLSYLSNIAPISEGVTKWAWTVARTEVSGLGPLANFTHDVNLLNLVFDCQSDNELLGCINFSGAQGSSLNLITIAGTFGAGIYCQAYTSNVDFNRIDINFTTGVVGPAFSMFIGNTNLLRSISVVQHNFNGAENDTDARYSPAYRIFGCSANTFLNLLAENCPRSLLLDSCNSNVFCSVEASFPDLSDSCLLDIVSGGDNVFQSLRGFNAEVLIRSQNVDVQDGVADNWAATNYTQGTRKFETLTPQKVELVSNQSIDFVRQTGAAGAQLFRWQTGQADDNPALTLTVSSSNGSSSIEVINIARNNGGDSSGYSVSMPTLYISVGMRSEKGYAVIQSEDDPTSSDILPGFRQTWFNPAESEIRDWVNIGGAMYKSAVYTPA